MRREQSEQQDTNHSSVIDDNENKNNEVNNCKLNYNKVYRNEVDNDEVESTDMSDTVDSSSNNYNEVDNNEVGVIVKINSTSDTNDTFVRVLRQTLLCLAVGGPSSTLPVQDSVCSTC